MLMLTMMAGALVNDRYLIQRALGHGSEGAVWLAQDRSRRDAAVVLKVVGEVSPAARARLTGEFRRLARLGHPNLVAVLDLEIANATAAGPVPAGAVFFTAPYVDGVPATQALRRVPADERLAILLSIAGDLASALAHVHAGGLLHHDVKPDNVVVTGDRRAVLVDLGLAGLAGLAGVGGGRDLARGTPRYLAPEALAGAAEPRSDLYGLGATLYELAGGEPPFVADDLATLVGQILLREPAALTERAPWVPPAMADLVRRLLAKEPAARPSSALAVLAELTRLGEGLGLAPSAAVVDADRAPLLPPPVGRVDLVDELVRALARLGSPAAPRGVRVVGPAGAGAAELVAEAVRQLQLAAAAGRRPTFAVLRGDLDELAQRLAASPASPGDAAASRWVDALLAGAERATAAALPTLVVAEADGDDERAAALVAALRGAAAPLSGGRTIVVIVITAEPGRCEPAPELVEIALAPLAAAEIAALAAAMLARPPRPAWAAALARACAGLPLVAAALVRAAAAQRGVAHADEVDIDELAGAGDLGAAATSLARRLLALPAPAGDLAAALAVWDGAADEVALAATARLDGDGLAAALSELDAIGALAAPVALAQGFAQQPRRHDAGWSCSRGGDAIAADRSMPYTLPARDAPELVRFAWPALGPALYDLLDRERRTELHRRAGRIAETAGADAIARARHLAVTGPPRAAVAACHEAATSLAARGQARRALASAQAGLSAGRSVRSPDSDALALLAARLATLVGDYPAAHAAAARAAGSRDPQLAREARLAAARAWQKQGAFDDAERALRALHDADPGDAEARGAYARLLVARGRFAAALALSDIPDESTTTLPAGLASCLESAGLARLYLGDADGADTAFARLEAQATDAADRALLGRARGLRGMVAHRRGDADAAARWHASAAAEARAGGERHAAAVHQLNQAGALSERGRFGAALPVLASAVAELVRLGATAELAAAQCNRGIALLAVGEVAAARRAADEAARLAAAHDTAAVAAFAAMLHGDLCRRDGDLAAAARAYGDAVARATARGDDHARLHALLALAEALAPGDAAAAAAALAEAGTLTRSEDDRDRATATRARIALATPTPTSSGSADGELVDALAGSAARARGAGRLDHAWRADGLAARLAERGGDRAAAQPLFAAAMAALAELLADTPEAYRRGIEADPEVEALRAAEPGGAARIAMTVALPAPIRSDTELRRLLAIARRLSSELRLEPLLDDVLDAAIELTAAERGVLLLRDTAGALVPAAARNFGGAASADDVSRSIAERAARSGEAVLTIDAGVDDRFGGAASIAALHLRSVLAVPLRQRGRITGTLYLDHRFRRGVFDDASVDLVRELADLAAVAIENARLIAENQRRGDEIAALNGRLEAEVAAQERELATVRSRLEPGDRAQLRHRFDAIVGRSPAIVAMLHTVERAAASRLPVVIQGESGTGKELVARALHEHGPRRERPFVAVNCGALPESLLESELFGHVRGAFTGAERDRRGLFEIADGGTLFLDEIAETGAAMQVKLLRALQDGELRRVGDERVRRVDVRVIAASNRGLAELVSAGRFREDLFYRLNVIRIEVPPLRQRVEDIPLLAEHVVRRLADGAEAPTLSRAALAALAAYPWPGNVRELENELARAVALGGARIDAAELSPQVTAARRARSGGDGPTSLSLRPQVEALERALIHAALGKSGGNQSSAARMLGLSRFGLQKKLKRYGM